MARAEASRKTARAIQDAAFALWRERDVEAITLAEIAARAGVTLQTVLRRFGSKQGLIDRCLESKKNEVSDLRERAPTGDARAAVEVLLTHYERDGRAVLRTLGLEGSSEIADRIVTRGREEHRRWCARVFAPFLPPPKGAAYASRLDAFVGATDIYLWKLWRLDLGRSVAQTKRAWEALVSALADASQGKTTGGHAARAKGEQP